MGRFRAFVGERSVIEKTAALAIGFAIASAAMAVAQMLLQAAGAGYTVTIWKRNLDLYRPLIWLLTLVVLLALLALAIRFLGLSSYDEDDLRECPHCLSDIPAAARVCEFCTRDVEPAV